MITSHGILEDVQHLAAVPPVLPAGQTPLWGSGADTETNAASIHFSAAPTTSAPAPASVSVSAAVQVASQAAAQTPALVRAQNQPPVPASVQAAAMPQMPVSALLKASPSVPVQASTAVQAPASAPPQVPVSVLTVELTMVSSTSPDASAAMDKPQISGPGLVSGPIPVTLPAPLQSVAPVAAPVLQPAGSQTTVLVPPCASLVNTQQNIAAASASSTLQQEPSVEVGIKPKFVHF